MPSKAAGKLCIHMPKFRNKNSKTQKNGGFTLIELLVVISIIGFLASIVVSTTHQAALKAQDQKVIGDLNQMANAFELYYSDNGYYPLYYYGDTSPADFPSNTPDYNATLGPAMQPYVAALPQPPGKLPPYDYRIFDQAIQTEVPFTYYLGNGECLIVPIGTYMMYGTLNYVSDNPLCGQPSQSPLCPNGNSNNYFILGGPYSYTSC